MIEIIHSDNKIHLKTMADNSVDSIVMDGPYGLGFMGKEWDTFKKDYLEEKLEIEEKRRPRTDGRKVTGFGNSVYAGSYDISKSGNQKFQEWFYEIAIELFRVLKPGGHLISFGGTRTYHRMVSGIEDAGFEIRDQLQWIFGSGFPKSLNCGNGIGTALKPANEPILLARKPLSEKTVAANILKWGTGGLNIDECRIGLNGEKQPSGSAKRVFSKNGFNADNIKYGDNTITPQSGRFPSNVIFDEQAAEILDNQTGNLKSGAMTKPYEYTNNGYSLGKPTGSTKSIHQSNEGGASRFFYCAKTNKSERNKGLENFEAKETGIKNGSGRGFSESDPYKKVLNQNTHPTVKPVKLMSYLVRLVTPKNGTVLDPFNGSGTTGIACKINGYNYIGIEREKEYVDISRARIDAWEVEESDKQLSIF